MQISANILKSTSFHASNEETRFYLCGVYVEFGEKFARLIATNGHTLMVAKSDYEAGQFRPTFDDGTLWPNVIVPADLLAGVKAGTRNPRVNLRISKGDDREPIVTIEQAGQPTISGRAIDGTFPDWRQVIPAPTPDPKPDKFNPDYIARFGKSAKLLTGSNGINLNGKGDGAPALVTFDGTDDAFGVIMPMRGGGEPRLPDWMSE